MLSALRRNDAVMRVVHTFWQAFLAVFLVGASGLLSGVLATHNFSDVKSALLALVVAALAAGFSALKNVTASRS